MSNEQNYESFSNLASSIQSIVFSVGLVLSGIWAITTFVELAESKKNIAEIEAKKVETELNRRKLDNDKVVNTSISAKQIYSEKGEFWVMIEAGFQNTGNLPVKIDFNEKTKFYVSKVNSITDDGIAEYGDRKNLKFDYQDKTITWAMLRPGAFLEKMHAIQKVEEKGLYLARLSIDIADSSVGEGREFSSDIYFTVN